jgi:hypothetical protein
MNDHPIPEYLSAIVRNAIVGFGGFLVGKGVISAEQSPELVGAGMTLFGIAWSLYQKYGQRQKLNDAKAS